MTDIFKSVLNTPQRARWQHQGVECAVHFVTEFETFMGCCLITDDHALKESSEWDEPLSSGRWWNAQGSDLLDVHGGVTYGPKPVEGGHIVGFDTSHFSDYSPYGNTKGLRWLLGDVIDETNRMASQIARYSSMPKSF